MAKLTDEKPDFDARTLRMDLATILDKQKEAAELNGDKKVLLASMEAERGYHMGAFRALISLSKKAPEYIDDYSRTFLAGIDVIRELASESTQQLELVEPKDNTDRTVASIKEAAEKRAKRKSKQPEGVH